MLVAGPGLPPKGYVYLLTREVRSSDAGAVVATNLEQSLSVIVHAAYALAAYACKWAILARLPQRER